MNRTYVEKLPEGNVHIYPDQVFVITDKLSEEVTDENGETYMVHSYVIVDVLTPEAYAILQAEEINLLKDATVELTDIVLGGL